MKKYFISLAIVTTLLGACSHDSSTNDQTHIQENTNIPFTYSLMYDADTQIKIKELLLQNQISQADIDAFFKSVNQFNLLMGDMPGAQNGFATTNLLDLPFDYSHMMTAWQNGVDYMDQNCRLTAFTLLKDSIDVNTDEKLADDNSVLMIDLAGIEENPNLNFNEDEIVKFNNLFMDVIATNTTDQATHVEEIKKAWASRGVKFNTPDQLSLITIFIHDPYTGDLFIGHTGVLIQTEDAYLFLEKVAPNEPYIASEYKTLDEFKQYLQTQYDEQRDDNGSKPIYMKNDQWLD